MRCSHAYMPLELYQEHIPSSQKGNVKAVSIYYSNDGRVGRTQMASVTAAEQKKMLSKIQIID